MSLEMTLDADVSGEGEVVFTIHAVNAGSAVRELSFPSGQIADVIVFRAEAIEGEDAPIWRWSDDRMFTQAVETVTLAPGETLERVHVWEDPPPDEYTAVATLDAETASAAEARTTLLVQ